MFVNKNLFSGFLVFSIRGSPTDISIKPELDTEAFYTTPESTEPQQKEIYNLTQLTTNDDFKTNFTFRHYDELNKIRHMIRSQKKSKDNLIKKEEEELEDETKYLKSSDDDLEFEDVDKRGPRAEALTGFAEELPKPMAQQSSKFVIVFTT